MTSLAALGLLLALIFLVAPTRTVKAVKDDSPSGTTGTETYDLPSDRAMTAVWVHHHAEFGTTETITHDKVEVRAGDQSIFTGMDGDQIRRIAKFQRGRQPTDTGAAATVYDLWELFMCGRTMGDPAVKLPPFSNLQLKLDWTVSASPNVNLVDVIVEELRGVDPSKGWMKRIRLDDTWDPSSINRRVTKFQGGGDNVPLAAVYIDDAGTDANLNGEPILMELTDPERIVVEKDLADLREINRNDFAFHDDTRPTNFQVIPLARQGIPGDGPPTYGDNPRLTTEPASGAGAGPVQVFTEDYLPLG